MNKNILVDFSKKIIISTTILILISSTTIYYIKKNALYNKLGLEIKEHLDLCINAKRGCFEKDSSAVSSNFIKHIKMIDFSFFSIYNKKNQVIYTYTDQNTNSDVLKTLQKHFKIKKLKIPNKDTIDYSSLEVSYNNYYLSVVYPIRVENKLLGYISGYKNIDKSIILDVESDIYHVITTIIFSIFIFSLTIFPIIYNAYKKLKRSEKRLLLSNIDTVHILGNAIALRDSDTNEHNYRVTIYAVKFATSINLNNTQIQKLIIGSFLHDIGKIGISDTILLKNSKLTDEEFKTMQEHVNKGLELIKDKEWLENAKDIIMYHHEKYDGSGYPNGFTDKNIPTIARVFSIIDVFDALTSKRPYKEAFSYEKSIAILKNDSDIHFDGNFLKSFIKISKQLHQEISLMSPEQLKNELNSIIEKYFSK